MTARTSLLGVRAFYSPMRRKQGLDSEAEQPCPPANSEGLPGPGRGAAAASTDKNLASRRDGAPSCARMSGTLSGIRGLSAPGRGAPPAAAPILPARLTLRRMVRMVGAAILLVSACEAAEPVTAGRGPAPILQWQEHRGYRSLPTGPSAGGSAGFLLMDRSRTGVLFTNALAAERSLTNHVLLNGSGVAAGDVDGDGWCDLFLCALGGQSRLYRNLGDWRFDDITEVAGVRCSGLDGTGAVLADVDGDGDLDLLVATIGGGVRCFLNDGQAHFKEVTAQAGLASLAGSMSLALADVDGNGTLDLYAANYRTWTARDSFSMQIRVNVVEGKRVVTRVNGRPVTEPDLVGRFAIDETGGLVENGEAGLLYRNEGQGHFTAVPWTNGVFLDEAGKPLRQPPYDWGLTAVFRDMNGDRAPDLYVCSDLGSPDRVWINLGEGRFHKDRDLWR